MQCAFLTTLAIICTSHFNTTFLDKHYVYSIRCPRIYAWNLRLVLYRIGYAHWLACPISRVTYPPNADMVFFLWIDRSYLWRSFATMGNVGRLSSEWARFFGCFSVRGRIGPFRMYGFPSVANRFLVHCYGATYI